MTKLAWCTDVHFDHAGSRKRDALALELNPISDCCVITGDISTGDRLVEDLTAFQYVYGKPVYFVLGNHDFYGSSFREVTHRIEVMCAATHDLRWLNGNVVYYTGDSQLCGAGGWYDYQAGLTSERLNLIMNDWVHIDDFKEKFAHYRASMDSRPLTNMLRELGQQSAIEAGEALAGVTSLNPIIFCTHVPPFAKAAWHMGKNSDDSNLPFFSNIALGFALNNWAEQNPDAKLTTLCGHVHSSGEYQATPNHLVLTGSAEYGSPRVERIFEV